jgi:hypothetical protein
VSAAATRYEVAGGIDAQLRRNADEAQAWDSPPVMRQRRLSLEGELSRSPRGPLSAGSYHTASAGGGVAVRATAGGGVVRDPQTGEQLTDEWGLPLLQRWVPSGDF